MQHLTKHKHTHIKHRCQRKEGMERERERERERNGRIYTSAKHNLLEPSKNYIYLIKRGRSLEAQLNS